MKISSNISQFNSSPKVIKNLYTKKISKDELKAIKEEVIQNVNAFTFKSFSIQTQSSSIGDKFIKDYKDFQVFLKDIDYNGKNIASLSKDEATKLVSKDGFFGIQKTANRIADFVINGANGDKELFDAGKNGMLNGFKSAQKMWGERLPEISQKTINLATELVNKAMLKSNLPILNIKG